MLDLKKIYDYSSNYRNSKVLEINNYKVDNGNTFAEEYGYLCGGPNDGILNEESQEILFEISGITIFYESKSKYMLRQRDNLFEIKKVIGKEGSFEPSEHMNFNKMIYVMEG